MAIRLERSGELMFIRGVPDEPEKPRKRNKSIQLVLWLVLIVLASGVLFMGPHAPLDWATVNHAFRSVVTATW
jgi:hypothetical protein